MKRRDLISRIGEAAKTVGVEFELVREGSGHSIFRCDEITLVVPRHNEIAEYTAIGIFKQAEPALGEGWWK
jgi:hypothetical protein